MNCSRRDFLRWSGAASILATTGCTEMPAALRELGLIAPEAPAGGPSDAPDQGLRDLESHVLSRLTYGARPGDYARVRAMGVQAFIEEQLHPERIDNGFCDWKVRRCESIDDATGDLFEYKEDLLWDELARATVLRAVYSERQLYEVMVQFWTDHFNIDSSKGDCKWLKTADDRDVIRAHAMGRFSELLRAVVLSPAMLWYLDGRVNRKSGPDEMPNENYARELLELHTLGVHGGYSQRDVMEVARCLTGWTVKTDGWFGKGKVEFDPNHHDDGEKVVLGERIRAGEGRRDVDRVLEIVSAHPSTALYLAKKLCVKFVAYDPNSGAIGHVAEAFERSDGDIRETLAALFKTDEFLATRDNKLKRPLRYIVSAMRATAADTMVGDDVLDFLVRMGHAPFQYPTPDGYPDEAAPWLGTMLWRWQFALALASNRLDETRVDVNRLRGDAGGDEGLMTHLLARTPTEAERLAYHSITEGPALLLASPAFQRY